MTKGLYFLYNRTKIFFLSQAFAWFYYRENADLWSYIRLLNRMRNLHKAFSTFCLLRPKHIKLQNLILCDNSCCEKCANFKIVLEAVSSRLKNVPQDLGDAVDMSMCTYTGMFPKLDCVLCKCHKCGVGNLQKLIMEGNSILLRDTSKNVLIKQWVKTTMA